MSQQIINIGSAPNDGTGDQLRVSFDKTNDNFSELYTGAGSSSEGIWNYNQTDTDTTTSPVSGRFRTNNSSSAAATQIAIHVTTIRGIDRTKTLQRLHVGDVIELDDPINNNAWCRYVVQSAPVDYTTWFQINVGLLASGTSASSDNQEINFIFTANTNPAPGTTSEYRFSTATTPPPGSGYIRINNATLGAATILYVNNITNNGTDIKRVLADLIVGQELAIQDQANNANYADYTITSAVIDQTTYFEIPVTSTASGGAITNNTVIAFRIVGAAAGGGGISDAPSDGVRYVRQNAAWVSGDAAYGNVSNSGTPANGQWAQWTDSTHIQGVTTATMPFVELAGDTMTGALTLSADPTSALHAATKQYVDARATSIPQGRLNLSGLPVMVISNAGVGTVYYTPYVGDQVPLYNGTSFAMTTFTQLSQATTDTTKSPAAMTANTNADMFIWDDAGTLRCTRGPTWSGTSHGTGAGTSELIKVKGLWLNAQNITNGPAAQRGTYVGSVHSNASATIDWIFGQAGSGGVAGSFGVWNAYNRILTSSVVRDSGANYTYSSATIRQARGSTGNQISFLIGLQEEAVYSSYSSAVSTSGAIGAQGYWGVGFDSLAALSTPHQLILSPAASTCRMGGGSSGLWFTPIGWHSVYALEASDDVNNNTFNFFTTGSLTLLIRN